MPTRSLLDFMSTQDGGNASGEALVHKALETVRRHLGMDVAYVSQITGDQSVFRDVDAPGLEGLVKVGDTHALDDVYCRHILEGRLPQLMPDTSREPLAAAMPITQAGPIGAHVSVPLRGANGDLYGMFCCFSAEPKPTLNDRDLDITRAFAGLVADQISTDMDSARDTIEKRERIEEAMGLGDFQLVFQPIVDLLHHSTVGFECLSRFASRPVRSPDKWFAEAEEVGLGMDLELAVVKYALGKLDAIPGDMTLSLNISPHTVLAEEFPALFDDQPVERLVLEITEHARVADYDVLARKLEPLRSRGMSLAIDDAGAGYSGLQHMLLLCPDIIKLDMSLTSNVNDDAAKSSLATALLMFARQTGGVIVAEGIETAAELKTLKSLGIHRGQGYHLGRPAPLEDVLAGLDTISVKSYSFG